MSSQAPSLSPGPLPCEPVDIASSELSSVIEILHVHPDFVSIHKPAGIPFHTETSDSGEQLLGIVARLTRALPQYELFPVHRLDKVTSGIMLFARNKSALSVLSQKFENREMSKRYIAISDQKPQQKSGLISGDMEKSRNGSWRLLRSTNRPAVTQFRSTSLYPNLKKHWLFLLAPQTGKTHQLRVMMKSVGSPIKGDERYGGTPSDRCYLHAYGLAFEYDGHSFHMKDSVLQGALFERLECLDFDQVVEEM